MSQTKIPEKLTLANKVYRFSGKYLGGLIPHFSTRSATPEKGNPSVMNGHYREYKHSVFVSWRRRTYSFSWVWAIDGMGRKVFTPFETRMNITSFYYRIGYVSLHISNKHNWKY